jgi:Flp pilus assembly pilin Flp
MDVLLGRLLLDESGQDVVEYALLTAVIGLAGIAVFEELRTGIASTFQSWNTAANDLWEPPAPGSSGP